MISRKTKANIFIIFVTLLALLFYGFFISKNKGSIEINQDKQKTDEILLEKGVTKFSNVEYKTSDKEDREFTTRGKEALISKKKPDLIELNEVHSFTKLKDGTILNIRSDKANYFKRTKNISYIKNVIITNKDGKITADFADFYQNKNLIRLTNNVIFKDTKSVIKGDIAELNTINNSLENFKKKNKDKVYGQTKSKK